MTTLGQDKFQENPDVNGKGKAPDWSGSFDDIYKIENTNWYKSYPYGFMHRNRSVNADGSGNGTTLMWLPIGPENLNITTMFATNIQDTLYGIVEEHSETRYFDIRIQGTTGFAPRYIRPGSKPVSSGGRLTSQPGFNVSLGGYFQEAVGVINQIADNVNDLVSQIKGSDDITGIAPQNSGYTAFHNLYRFFLQYKKDAAGTDSKTGNKKRQLHPLTFLNYKDRTKYDVSPISFTLTRSADDPMMYNYNIVLRGFNLRGIDSEDQVEENLLAGFGLGAVGGLLKNIPGFDKVSNAVGSAANIVSSLF